MIFVYFVSKIISSWYHIVYLMAQLAGEPVDLQFVRTGTSDLRSPWATGPSQLHLAARRDTEYGLAPNWDWTRPPGLPEVSLTTGDTVRRWFRPRLNSAVHPPDMQTEPSHSSVMHTVTCSMQSHQVCRVWATDICVQSANVCIFVLWCGSI